MLLGGTSRETGQQAQSYNYRGRVVSGNYCIKIDRKGGFSMIQKEISIWNDGVGQNTVHMNKTANCILFICKIVMSIKAIK